MPILFVDEKAGSDATGTGAELSPFASPLAAYQSLHPAPVSDAAPTSIANFLVRKADSVERNEWVELSATATKRLGKAIEAWRKKEARLAAEGEKPEKERLAAEERDKKRREEAKGIVLVDDESKGSAQKVNPLSPCTHKG